MRKMRIRGSYNPLCNCTGCRAGREETAGICIVHGAWRIRKSVIWAIPESPKLADIETVDGHWKIE